MYLSIFVLQFYKIMKECAYDSMVKTTTNPVINHNTAPNVANNSLSLCALGIIS
jgi:hypothetical protein